MQDYYNMSNKIIDRTDDFITLIQFSAYLV